MKYNRIFEYYGRGVCLYSDDNRRTWYYLELTQFPGPKELRII